MVGDDGAWPGSARPEIKCWCLPAIVNSHGHLSHCRLTKSAARTLFSQRMGFWNQAGSWLSGHALRFFKIGARVPSSVRAQFGLRFGRILPHFRRGR